MRVARQDRIFGSSDLRTIGSENSLPGVRMRGVATMASAGLAFLLLTLAPPALPEDTGHPDLTPCTGSQPEPSHSGTWGVSFCNRTGHDVVVEFRDNDCPAENWARRGDVYEKVLRPGESATVFLCYARETQPAATPPEGTPMLRIPGGKGVTTTWAVVGDCGNRSDRVHLDARSFYDRGTYQTGIILLQHPQGRSHCFGEPPGAAGVHPPAPRGGMAAAAAAGSSPSERSPTRTPEQANADRPGSADSTTGPTSAGSATGKASPAATSTALPVFRAAVDSKDRFQRTVRVFATSDTGAPDYSCRVALTLGFSDGSSWSDRVKVDVAKGARDSLVSTRKYGKSVTKVDTGPVNCSP